MDLPSRMKAWDASSPSRMTRAPWAAVVEYAQSTSSDNSFPTYFSHSFCLRASSITRWDLEERKRSRGEKTTATHCAHQYLCVIFAITAAGPGSNFSNPCRPLCYCHISACGWDPKQTITASYSSLYRCQFWESCWNKSRREFARKRQDQLQDSLLALAMAHGTILQDQIWVQVCRLCDHRSSLHP